MSRAEEDPSAIPLVHAATSFHCHYAPGLAAKELQQLMTPKPLPQNNLPSTIRSMDLEHVLRQIQPITLTSLIDASLQR